MTATLKFNRKVYVIPEDKYNSMVGNRKLRDDVEAEHDSVRLQRPPAQPSTAKAESLRTLSSVADETTGRRTHSPEGGSSSSAKIEATGMTEEAKSNWDSKSKPKQDSKSKSNKGGSGSGSGSGSGGSSGGSSDGSSGGSIGSSGSTGSRDVQEKVIRKTLFALLEPEKRRNLMKVYASLFDRRRAAGAQGVAKTVRGRGLSIPGLQTRDLFLALLHTQCERAARPDDYKALYTRILRNNVPLSYIGNKKLRRVLHYLKNKRARDMSTGRSVGLVGRSGTNKKNIKKTKTSWITI